MFFIVLIFVITIFYLCIGIKIGRKSDSLRCLLGKTAIVTGGNSGLGYGTAFLLASRGCRVIIADCVNAEESRDKIIKITQNPNVLCKLLDLSSLKAVREFCEDIKKTEKKIDILVNNAGIGASSKPVTEDGLNFVMQVNFFGAFLMTHLLLEPLKAAEAARVIFVGSVTIYLQDLTVENLNLTNFEMKDTHHPQFYKNSKLCNVLAAQEFGKRLKKYGITANSVDPVGLKTNIFQSTFKIYKSWTVRWLMYVLLALHGHKDEVSAAQTYLHVASSEKLDNKTSGHYAACARMYKPKILKDQHFCDQIWNKTEKLVKLREDEKL